MTDFFCTFASELGKTFFPVSTKLQRTMFPTLNLPPIDARVRQGANGRLNIYDEQRQRFVTLTAEEWVRQHFVHYLVHTLGYPSPLIGNEVALEIAGVKRRCDTVVYSPLDGHPLAIVEYKAPNVGISQTVFGQIQSYNSVLHADFLIVSNGMHHFCCHNDYETMKAAFLPEIPRWEQINPRQS